MNDTKEEMSEQQLGIDILGVNDEDRGKFIDASDGSEKDKKEGQMMKKV